MNSNKQDYDAYKRVVKEERVDVHNAPTSCGTPTYGTEHTHHSSANNYSWIAVIIVFLITWGLLWLAFWVSKAEWTTQPNGDSDVFKTAAVSLLLAIVVCVIVYGARWRW